MKPARPQIFIGLYGLFFEALAPLWRWWLRRRLSKGKETTESINQKWMVNPPPRPAGMLVWGHAVGVGEALALVGLMKRLQERRPDLHFLITTTARTSGQALKQQHLGPRFIHWFAPVDVPSNVTAFIQHWHPDLAIWCEMDLWPSLIGATQQHHIPRVLVNARLSTASMRKRRWAKALYAELLDGFELIWAQNTETHKHLLTLGAPADRLHVTGTIKSMVPPPPVQEHELAFWKQALKDRPVWVLASSHDGEEALAIAAHQILLADFPDAFLIIVPRDISRGASIAATAESGAALRSQHQILTNPTSIYVADTLGELGLWYRLGAVAMVGGSWVPIGGHNPFEATLLGTLVLHGPFVENFKESYAILQTQGLCLEMANAIDIAHQVSHVWRQGTNRPNALHPTSEDPIGPLLNVLSSKNLSVEHPMGATEH